MPCLPHLQRAASSFAGWEEDEATEGGRAKAGHDDDDVEEVRCPWLHPAYWLMCCFAPSLFVVSPSTLNVCTQCMAVLLGPAARYIYYQRLLALLTYILASVPDQRWAEGNVCALGQFN